MARDGARISYATFGSGEPALLLLSWRTDIEEQFGDPARSGFYEAIAAGLRVVVADRRGVGASSGEAQPTTDAQVDDVAAVLDGAGVTAAHLIADNDACYLAVRFAAVHPERVRRLALWSPFVSGRDARQDEMRRFAGLIRSDWDAARRQWAEYALPKGTEAERAAFSDGFARRLSASAAASYMDWEASEDLSPVLPTVNAPTLVLAPRRLGSRSMGVASLLPNALFEPVDADPIDDKLNVRALGTRMTSFLTGTDTPHPSSR
jgi:pimeloyl-ACP methyl ester carboxylesterase